MGMNQDAMASMSAWITTGSSGSEGSGVWGDGERESVAVAEEDMVVMLHTSAELGALCFDPLAGEISDKITRTCPRDLRNARDAIAATLWQCTNAFFPCPGAPPARCETLGRTARRPGSRRRSPFAQPRWIPPDIKSSHWNTKWKIFWKSSLKRAKGLQARRVLFESGEMFCLTLSKIFLLLPIVRLGLLVSFDILFRKKADPIPRSLPRRRMVWRSRPRHSTAGGTSML
jgi:hypothetical protein